MRSFQRFRLAAVVAALAVWTSPSAVTAENGKEDVNLLSWGAGALVVQGTGENATGQWSPSAMLDEYPETGWATERGNLKPHVLVIELAARGELHSLVFDNAQADQMPRSTKRFRLEISERKDGGFVPVLSGSLAASKDGQKFALKTPARGRYVKLIVLDNWGDAQFMEIMNFKGYGRPLAKAPLTDHSGTYGSDYGNFHIQQIGSSVSGCYEHGNGLIENGGFDGRVLRFTWSTDVSDRARTGGPAMMVFPDDGKSFIGHYWHKENAGTSAFSDWNGVRISTEIGSCPNWTPDATGGIQRQLATEGRALLYGILFDTDSDVIKAESKPALDALLAAARSEPTWSFELDGHTDDTGDAARNLPLSQNRAAAVKAYLVKAGVDAGRLTTNGFGSSRPVASNATALGRSQNRRVEVVKK